MATTAAGTPYVEASDLVAGYPAVSLALANHIDGLESASGTAIVNTSQSTASTSFVDLATAGPAVTVTTGTKALVIVGCASFGSVDTWGNYMGFAVSGASTVAATVNDSNSTGRSTSRTGLSLAVLVTGLTAGSNTFTAKYRSEGGGNTSSFYFRKIIVIDMGS